MASNNSGNTTGQRKKTALSLSLSRNNSIVNGNGNGNGNGNVGMNHPSTTNTTTTTSLKQRSLLDYNNNNNTSNTKESSEDRDLRIAIELSLKEHQRQQKEQQDWIKSLGLENTTTTTNNNNNNNDNNLQQQPPPPLPKDQDNDIHPRRNGSRKSALSQTTSSTSTSTKKQKWSPLDELIPSDDPDLIDNHDQNSTITTTTNITNVTRPKSNTYTSYKTPQSADTNVLLEKKEMKKKKNAIFSGSDDDDDEIEEKQDKDDDDEMIWHSMEPTSSTSSSKPKPKPKSKPKSTSTSQKENQPIIPKPTITTSTNYESEEELDDFFNLATARRQSRTSKPPTSEPSFAVPAPITRQHLPPDEVLVGPTQYTADKRDESDDEYDEEYDTTIIPATNKDPFLQNSMSPQLFPPTNDSISKRNSREDYELEHDSMEFVPMTVLNPDETIVLSSSQDMVASPVHKPSTSSKLRKSTSHPKLVNLPIPTSSSDILANRKPTTKSKTLGEKLANKVSAYRPRASKLGKHKEDIEEFLSGDNNSDSDSEGDIDKVLRNIRSSGVGMVGGRKRKSDVLVSSSDEDEENSNKRVTKPPQQKKKRKQSAELEIVSSGSVVVTPPPVVSVSNSSSLRRGSKRVVDDEDEDDIEMMYTIPSTKPTTKTKPNTKTKRVKNVDTNDTVKTNDNASRKKDVDSQESIMEFTAMPVRTRGVFGGEEEILDDGGGDFGKALFDDEEEEEEGFDGDLEDDETKEDEDHLDHLFDNDDNPYQQSYDDQRDQNDWDGGFEYGFGMHDSIQDINVGVIAGQGNHVEKENEKDTVREDELSPLEDFVPLSELRKMDDCSIYYNQFLLDGGPVSTTTTAVKSRRKNVTQSQYSASASGTQQRSTGKKSYWKGGKGGRGGRGGWKSKFSRKKGVTKMGVTNSSYSNSSSSNSRGRRGGAAVAGNSRNTEPPRINYYRGEPDFGGLDLNPMGWETRGGRKFL